MNHYPSLIDNVRNLCHTVYRDERWFFKGGCLYKEGSELEKLLGLEEYELDTDSDRFNKEWQRYDLDGDITLLITLKDGSWYFILDGTENLNEYLST